MIFLFGIRQTIVLSVLLKNLRCTHCQKTDTVTAHFISRHFHLFWMPLFPIGKKTATVCDHCKQNLREQEMPGEYRQVIHQYKPRAKTKLWQWTGLLIVGSIFALFFLMGIVGYILQ